MNGTTAGTGPGRVVVGVDGSPPAHTAVLWAAAEAALAVRGAAEPAEAGPVLAAVRDGAGARPRFVPRSGPSPAP
ncbi:hypothetical protein [Streptomyces roseicoloratus]|uniref:UspA domain-containing protein n=1 Tax=Streptomyces roseicoloratus TaxID=2508722 RepID=A0ABY9RSU2_9ACTN|nr:hypothetical protein [Streptomyces roseicoloratus]WMX44010.1 hypothetical protein RGF97_02855 [Streptomyces roseicoloratus]